MSNQYKPWESENISEIEYWKKRYLETRSAQKIEIDKMVDLFLIWPLPKTVCPDQCALDRNFLHRTGTNLLTADEARQMFEYILMAQSMKDDQ